MPKIFIGKVVSTKMKDTVVVLVERKLRHPLYRKVIARRKKYKAHVDGLELEVGDAVRIRETRPISKDKHFIVMEKLEKKISSKRKT
ncbi:30S ribosomal protein S17 [Candidatus Roizmanbacteria bacterium]|nr:30S ribosomal protein S17 [Candidatus Roizmanbacteria bacterium]